MSLRKSILLGLVQIPPNNALDGTHARDDASADPDVLPRQATALVQAPGLVPEERADAHNGGEVDGGDGSGLGIREAGELGLQPAVGRLDLLPGLGLLGGGGGGGGILLALEAGGLGLRLDLLLEEVGGDGVDAGKVDVDEGRCGGGLVGDDLGGLRGSSLAEWLDRNSRLMGYAAR